MACLGLTDDLKAAALKAEILAAYAHLASRTRTESMLTIKQQLPRITRELDRAILAVSAAVQGEGNGRAEK